MAIFQSEFITLIFSHIQGTIGALSIAAPFLMTAIALEIILPGQKINVRSSVFNIIYTPIFLTISSIILHHLWAIIPKDIIKGIFNISNYQGYPQVIIFIFYLLVFDFCYYWLHRAQHQWRWLWKFHATHHSDPNVSALTTSRHHWLEDVFRFIPVLLPLSIIFGSLGSLPLWALVAPGLYGIFIHWNCPFQMRPIQKLVVTPWFHRIHHSISLEHRDKNFAVFFPFWDVIFGTAIFSKKSMPYPQTGIETRIPINSWRRLLPIPQQ